MMNTSLLEKFPVEDMSILHSYFENYGGNSSNDCVESCCVNFDKMPYILRHWSQNKEDLFKMFGEKFILEKEITYSATLEELENLYIREIRRDEQACNFVEEYLKKIDHVYCREGNTDVYWTLRSFVYDYIELIHNKYEGDNMIITLNNHVIKIQNGCGIIKTLKKLTNILGIDPKLYEAFRNCHSRVLQNKKTKGKLCLSIHPMDYVTMSDNDYHWESCMTWTNYAGEYRLGTVEMMNSPYCVVAYLKGNEDMEFIRWNSKKWRQLIMITPDLILGNRQYPYEHKTLEEEALKWMRELASSYSGYGPYSDSLIKIVNRQDNFIGEKAIRFDLDFDYMYNDIYNSRKSYFNPNYEYSNYSMNLSGPAVCIQCGEVMEDMEGKESFVTCPSCSGMFYCDGCGNWEIGECHEVDGRYYCSYCIENDFVGCGVCDMRFHDSYIVDLFLHIKGYDGNFNGLHKVYLCEECLRDIYPTSDIPREAINSCFLSRVIYLKDISDDVLKHMFLDYSEDFVNYLLEMKQAETFEKMHEIEKKYCDNGIYIF